MTEPSLASRSRSATRACGSTKRSRSNGRTSASGASLGVAEDELQMRVGGDRCGRIGAKGPDVHAFVNGFEQTRERLGALIHGAIIRVVGFGIWNSEWARSGSGGVLQTCFFAEHKKCREET